MKLRVLCDPPADGAWNMALDEALLASAGQSRLATLRFYQWSEPTLSLGYFQAHGDRGRHAASRRCPIVRRASGGGAILHDRELTYSLALPADHPWARRSEALYRLVHLALVELLAEWGIAARLCPAAERFTPAGSAPFLCFQRRTALDVVAGPLKLCGSAQRRRQGAVLQHGSLLLARSAFAPELPGLEELAGRPFDLQLVRAAWLERLLRRFEAEPQRDAITAAEQSCAATIAREKYGSGAWTLRR